MTFKTLSTLGIAVALLGLIACGKNDNNLNIDGTYRYVETQYSDGVVEKAAGLSLLKIEKNVGTHYDFSADKKGVEIYQTEKTIQGRTLISSKILGENKCADKEFSIESADLSTASKINLSKNSLVLSADGVSTVYEAISAEEFEALTASAKAGAIDVGCLDEKATLTKVLAKAKTIEAVEAAEKATETTEVVEKAIEEEVSEKAVEATDKDSADEATTVETKEESEASKE